MKKLLKIAGFLVLAAATLAVILSLAIRIFFPPEKIKALVVKQIEGQLHRAVTLGDVSIGLFTGLRISNFKLSEAPDFSKGTFISSERFVVRPRLLPLLSKKLFVKELELVKPDVTVIRYADGKTFNFSNLSSTAPASSGTSSPLALLVSKASIEAGRLNFIDQSPAAQSVTVGPLNLIIRNFTLAGPVDLQMDAQVNMKGVDIGVNFAGVVSFVQGSARIKKCAIASGASKILIDGEARHLMGGEPAFDVKITIANLEPALINALAAPPASMKIQGSLAGEATAKGTLAALEFSSSLNFGKAALASSGAFVKAAGIPMELKASGEFKNQKDLDLQQLKLSLASFNLTGKGKVLNVPDPARKFQLAFETNEFPVPELLGFLPAAALPKDVALAGTAHAAVTVDGSADSGQMKIHADAKALDVQYGSTFKKPGGVPLTFDASGAYSLPLALDFRNIEALLSRLQVGGTGTYKSIGEKSSYAFNLKTNDFQWEDASKLVPMMQEYALTGKTSAVMKITSAASGPDVKGTARLQGVNAVVQQVKISNIVSAIDFTMKDASGKLTADQLKHEYFSGKGLDVKWNLTDAADLAKISGAAALRQGPGEFQNIQKLTADSKAAKILFMPLTIVQKLGKATGGAIKIPSLDQVNFKSIAGDYVFKSGVMTIASFTMEGDVGATMKGTVGLAGAQPLDLQTQLKVGDTAINLTVKGTVADPKVSIDTKETGKQIMNAVKDKLGDHPEEKVKDLLKGLFNR